VCRSCGAIVDLEPGTRSPRRLPEVGGGFVADTVELTVWGRCGACAATPTAVTDRHGPIDTPFPTDAEEARP